MTSTLINPKTNPLLQPAYGLWQQYHPEQAEFAFHAGNLTEAWQWQERTRPALAETVGFQHLPSCDLAPEKLEEEQRGDFVREKVLLHTWRDAVMPVYILRPKKINKPAPVVIAFHGHGYGVKDIVGLWKDGRERHKPHGYHKDFAVALCRKGFIVAAPEISCFGERQTDFSYLDKKLGQEAPPSTCLHTAMLAFHLGGSVVGLRVHDGKRLIDYLQTLPDVDAGRIGAMGISGGGLHTFFSTCLDERIRACVVSGYYSTFQGSILAMHHCACNFVPGLARFGEMSDMVGLIAPRPMLVEAGDLDPIFPIAEVHKGMQHAREVYSTFGMTDMPQTDYFEGDHQISGALAYDFLATVLGAGK
jgi:dienelactone hydrolase